MKPKRYFYTTLATVILVLVLWLGHWGAVAQVTGDAPALRPEAVVNLATPEGVALMKTAWRYSDAQIVEVGFNEPGPDRRPSGPANRTHDIMPHAGAANFDDTQWAVLDPTTLDQRRCSGKLCFNWYRLNLTVPENVGTFNPAGSDVVFEIVVDDYAEIWVEGQLPLTLGQSGGPVVKGWNAPNRLVIGHNVQPGQQIQLAIFGINGPLSNPPSNYIWIRSASLEFYPSGRLGILEADAGGRIERLAPGMDVLASPGTKIEKIASGFLFTEGPVWVRDGGYLLFSDPNANNIYRWSPDGQVTVYRPKSGYTGTDIGEYHQPGSNGLTLDAEGRLTVNEHGNRRVTRIEKNGVVTVLADQYQGKRLNSPNDLVYRSDGVLFFTDPPFGLPQVYDDARKELDFSGVYALVNGELKLISTDLKGPNGIALSPDEKILYVGNWDPQRKVVMAYDVKPDGTLAKGQVFYDMTSAPGEDAIDGIKVDQQGNVYVSGPGGLWILSPTGQHLGTLKLPEQPHNLAWGDADGKTLYMTAQTSLYRVRLNIPGVRP